MTQGLGSGPRRWSGWGRGQTEFPLHHKALAFLKRALDGPGARLPDAGTASAIANTPPSRLLQIRALRQSRLSWDDARWAGETARYLEIVERAYSPPSVVSAP